MSALINFSTRAGSVLAIAGIINEFFLYDGACRYLLWPLLNAYAIHL